MKTLQEKIAVMQHAANGGKVRITDRKGSVVVDKGATLNWNWECVDYDIVEEPKRVWVNEYADGGRCAYNTAEMAKRAANKQALRIAVEYVEVIK